MATNSKAADAAATITKLPLVGIEFGQGRTALIPAPQLMHVWRGKQKRAGDLLPGDVVLLTTNVAESKDLLLTIPVTVSKVTWPDAAGPPEFIRVAGTSVCEVCGRELFDHPFDRRHKSYDKKPTLVIRCDGQLCKL